MGVIETEKAHASVGGRILVAIGVLAIVAILTGCSRVSTSSSGNSSAPSCSDVMSSIIQRERVGDTAGAINSEMDWLSKNCPSAYETVVGYVSTKGMIEQFGASACDAASGSIPAASLDLLRADGLCDSASSGDTASGYPGGGIGWDQAVSHAGTVQRVCGPLATTRYSDDDVFLNIGRDYPDPARFTIVIWDIGGVESLPSGTLLCTEGLISVWEGAAQIELRSTSAVEVWG